MRESSSSQLWNDCNVEISVWLKSYLQCLAKVFISSELFHITPNYFSRILIDRPTAVHNCKVKGKEYMVLQIKILKSMACFCIWPLLQKNRLGPYVEASRLTRSFCSGLLFFKVQLWNAKESTGEIGFFFSSTMLPISQLLATTHCQSAGHFTYKNIS